MLYDFLRCSVFPTSLQMQDFGWLRWLVVDRIRSIVYPGNLPDLKQQIQYILPIHVFETQTGSNANHLK